MIYIIYIRPKILVSILSKTKEYRNNNFFGISVIKMSFKIYLLFYQREI